MQCDPDFTNTSIIYVAYLQDDCFYIGTSTSLELAKKYLSSCENNEWLNLHKFIDIIDVKCNDESCNINSITEEYIKLYGVANVKDETSPYFQNNVTENDFDNLSEITSTLHSSSSLSTCSTNSAFSIKECYICNQIDHVSSFCPNKKHFYKATTHHTIASDDDKAHHTMTSDDNTEITDNNTNMKSSFGGMRKKRIAHSTLPIVKEEVTDDTHKKI